MQRILILSFITLLVFSCTTNSKKQTEPHKPTAHIIAFYNLENLFDTINDVGVRDGEFTPDGSKQWDSERYRAKQNNMSKVIADIGSEMNINGPSLIGLCEVENRGVLEDLIKTKLLQEKNYSIIHTDSPDERGIDVAMLYDPNSFELTSTKSYPLIIYKNEDGKRLYTRDQLLVSGKLEGDLIHIIVNHWPSRYGGLKRSIPSRKAAALLNRQIIDSLLTIDANAKIVTMGDLNDDPTDESIITHLKAHGQKDSLESKDLYNPLANDFEQGKGTLYYRGKWNLFDQIIVSQGLLSADEGLRFDSAYIFKKPYLIQQDGDFKGYLHRTYGGKKYLNGYSDHLPVYMVLK